MKIAIGFSPKNFSLDFPMSIPVDTSIYRDMNLKLDKGLVKVVVKYPFVSERIIKVEELFSKTNPFEKFKALTKLKNELGIINISSNGIGTPIEFYLSPRHLLNYIPAGFDNKNIGEAIAKNWYFKKLAVDADLADWALLLNRFVNHKHSSDHN